MNATQQQTVTFTEALERGLAYLRSETMALEVSYMVFEPNGGMDQPLQVWVDRTGTMRSKSRYDSMGRDTGTHPNEFKSSSIL